MGLCQDSKLDWVNMNCEGQKIAHNFSFNYYLVLEGVDYWFDLGFITKENDLVNKGSDYAKAPKMLVLELLSRTGGSYYPFFATLPKVWSLFPRLKVKSFPNGSKLSIMANGFMRLTLSTTSEFLDSHHKTALGFSSRFLLVLFENRMVPFVF